MNSLPWLSGSYAMDGSLVVQTCRVRVNVTIWIREEATFVQYSMLQITRTNWKFRCEIFQISVLFNPVVTQGTGPVLAMSAFPLWTKVPSERNGARPEDPEKIQLKVVDASCHI